MIAIGIRIRTQVIHFSVVEQNNEVNTILSVDKLIIPQALSDADKLNYVRKTFIDIINQYKVTRAGLRMLENNGRRIDRDRVSLEAVIQELFSGSSVEKYYGGGIGKISKLLDLPNNGALTKLIKGVGLPDHLSFLEIRSQVERESILSALASLNL